MERESINYKCKRRDELKIQTPTGSKNSFHLYIPRTHFMQSLLVYTGFILERGFQIYQHWEKIFTYFQYPILIKYQSKRKNHIWWKLNNVSFFLSSSFFSFGGVIGCPRNKSKSAHLCHPTFSRKYSWRDKQPQNYTEKGQESAIWKRADPARINHTDPSQRFNVN